MLHLNGKFAYFVLIVSCDLITSINTVAVKYCQYSANDKTNSDLASLHQHPPQKDKDESPAIDARFLSEENTNVSRIKRDAETNNSSLSDVNSPQDIEPFSAETEEEDEEIFGEVLLEERTENSPKCDEFENETCIIDHNSTCIGDTQYCSLSYHDYKKLLLDYIYPSTPEWILICSHLVVFVMGLVGNALVCIAVYTNQTMRTVTNIFIVNLAVADFFVILFCLPPTVVWDVTETWFMGKVMCKITLYFQTVSVTVSVLTLTFISIDRWYAICYPLRYKPRTERAWRSIVLIWIIGLLSDIPEFLYLTTKRKPLRFKFELFTQCVTTWEKDTDKAFHIVKSIVLYFIPLLFMTVAYFRIVRILWKSDTIPGHRESRTYRKFVQRNRSATKLAPNPTTLAQLNARRKASKMLVVVVFMFALCYMPVHALNIVRYTITMEQSDVIAVLSLFSHWLCYANSAVNPVIYNFMSGKFRREFRNAFEKCRCFRGRHNPDMRYKCEDRSLYQKNAKAAKPRIRSNYQFTSVRDITGVSHPVVETSFNDDDHVIDLHDDDLKNCTKRNSSLRTQAVAGTSGIKAPIYNAGKTALNVSSYNPNNCSPSSIGSTVGASDINKINFNSCTSSLNLAVYVSPTSGDEGTSCAHEQTWNNTDSLNDKDEEETTEIVGTLDEITLPNTVVSAENGIGSKGSLILCKEQVKSSPERNKNVTNVKATEIN